ncbi:hypothetical protein MPC4_20140 [Methylocella tundrae]|uniref:Uncharacterized protein n=1 Tax=Methylocella tundrae TaxID=227605 RepID=A0A4U8Z662_METTU|nr:protein of unknown function [Methylocella tundrae]VTZ25458.1 hypothetical protein MPC1_2370002 [Methylocella tundrae]VTZ49930.1 hypothetical protein MPC4_20140 [Methylocella tundrae]
MMRRGICLGASVPLGNGASDAYIIVLIAGLTVSFSFDGRSTIRFEWPVAGR